jgi:hypothetical protein
MCVCMYVCVYVCMYVCIYVFMYVSVCQCICITAVRACVHYYVVDVIVWVWVWVWVLRCVGVLEIQYHVITAAVYDFIHAMPDDWLAGCIMVVVLLWHQNLCKRYKLFIWMHVRSNSMLECQYVSDVSIVLFYCFVSIV